jgi:hypothetical protein
MELIDEKKSMSKKSCGTVPFSYLRQKLLLYPAYVVQYKKKYCLRKPKNVHVLNKNTSKVFSEQNSHFYPLLCPA